LSTTNFLPLQAQPFLLSGAGAIIGDTTLTLQTFTQIDGTLIQMSQLGTIAFLTLEPGNGTNEEQVSFTGVTQNSNGTATLTGVKYVAFVYPYTATTGLSKTHAGATTAILSNTSGFYNEFVNKNTDGMVNSLITFSSANIPQQDSYLAPMLDAQFAPKKYVDTVAVAGAPNANTTTKGIVQIATQAQVDAKTLVGSTSAYLVQPLNTQRSTLLSDYVLDTSPSANIITIAPSPAISAYTAGQTFSLKVLNTNTSAAVSVNVNGLGAKNIVKLNGSTSPAVGDIAVGQIITLEYDGTNFQLVTPVANAPATLSSISNFSNRIIYTSSSTFVTPTGISTVYVTLNGGGGGGGGATTGSSQVASAGGGGSGGYLSRYPYIVTAGSSYIVTVGSAGIGATSGTTSATAGGNSVFDSLIVTGGGAGNSQNGAGNANGGGAGSPNGTSGGNGNSGTSGAGANSYSGLGGTSVTPTSGNALAGKNASGTGAGASGGSIEVATAVIGGGNGAPGIVIIEW